jgi:hypothetical protein
MTISKLRRITFVPPCLAVILAAVQFAPVLAAADQTGSNLSGRILSQTGEPVVGARVLAYHLSSEEVFDSEATDAKGGYEISGLPYGYFDVAVETPQGLYVADQVVNVPPSGKVALSLNLFPYTEARADDGRSFPGTEQQPLGEARVQDKVKGGEFWKSPKGIGTIAGAGAVALLLIAGGGDDGGSASPSAP